MNRSHTLLAIGYWLSPTGYSNRPGSNARPKSSARCLPRTVRLSVLASILVATLGAAKPAPSPVSGPSPSTVPNPVFEKDDRGVRFGLVRVDPSKRTVSFPARVNMTNGIVEYAVVTDYGKTHESLFLTQVQATDLQAALLLLNAQPGGTNSLALPAGKLPARSAVSVRVAWETRGRRTVRPLETLVELLADPEGTKRVVMTPGPWLFNGSMFSQEGFAAHFEGSLVSLIVDPTAIINNPRPDRDDDDIHLPAAAQLPALNTEVTVLIDVPAP